MSDPVVVEVAIDAPAARVWQAFRDPVELRRWHGWEYDAIEAEIQQIYFDDVTASEPDLTLDTHGAGRFELEPRGEATVVRVVRAAPDGAAGWDGIYDEINEGWRSFVEQLRFYLERHAGEERRTLFIEREVDPPAGEEWFSAAHQRGVVADPSTLVIVAREKTIVSAYGIDEEAFAALRERFG
ncbi:SRPBCC domain-containing protein [Conexibacter stalactiti]|uniref:SRPBCC domain-containing protein n=1 Tax=Conexibacter stalactiti TaxID=1940611 RepID=A0ABU4HKR4_9ACTN|nr:SRPBCC domain-containing protein [Conexibacter stalactiti]MDW5593891.1 SRPBCC domain-containing protein [Conexibacter stalactiti]MEC5034533.1 SRPBCC domain-containing protein [Conexibacter stalactiti]